MNQYKNIDELIAKCVAKEASVSEKEIVDQWISISDMNRKYYSDIQVIYEIADEKPMQQKIDVSGAWEKFSKKLIAPEDKKVKIRRLLTSFYGKAAILLMMLGAAYFMMNNKEKEIVFISRNTALNDTLPDGTFVSLDPEATITYSSSFNNKNRDIKLTGQAYFNVQHNDNLPFIVQVENLFIKDIGTSFTVKANATDSIVTIHVEEGEVNFYSAQNRGIALIKNETGIYNKISSAFRKVNDPNVEPNKNITLSFENTRLEFVIDTINSRYNEHISLSCENLKSLELTATFKETTANPIVETIAETFGLSVVKTKGTTSLRGRSCK